MSQSYRQSGSESDLDTLHANPFDLNNLLVNGLSLKCSLGITPSNLQVWDDFVKDIAGYSTIVCLNISPFKTFRARIDYAYRQTPKRRLSKMHKRASTFRGTLKMLSTFSSTISGLAQCITNKRPT